MNSTAKRWPPNRDLHVAGDRKAYVRNGALGTIVAVHPDRRDAAEDALTVDFDGIGRIDIPRSIFDHHRTPAGRPEAARLHRAAARRQRPGARHRRHLAPLAADSSTSTAPPPEPPPLAIKHAGEPNFDAPQPKTESTESA